MTDNPIPKPRQQSQAERELQAEFDKEYRCSLGAELQQKAKILATENWEHTCTFVRRAVKEYIDKIVEPMCACLTYSISITTPIYSFYMLKFIKKLSTSTGPQPSTLQSIRKIQDG